MTARKPDFGGLPGKEGRRGRRGVRASGEPLEPCVCCERGVDSFDERWIDADVCRECSDALADAGDRCWEKAVKRRSGSRSVAEMRSYREYPRSGQRPSRY